MQSETESLNQSLSWFSEDVDRFCSNAWPVSRGVQVAALAASKSIRMNPPGICRISKTNMPMSPIKDVRHPAAPTFVPLELPWLQTSHSEEFVDMSDVLCSVTGY
jgi:hypothetical protein